jgi:hypothetical protein
MVGDVLQTLAEIGFAESQTLFVCMVLVIGPKALVGFQFFQEQSKEIFDGHNQPTKIIKGRKAEEPP